MNICTQEALNNRKLGHVAKEFVTNALKMPGVSNSYRSPLVLPRKAVAYSPIQDPLYPF